MKEKSKREDIFTKEKLWKFSSRIERVIKNHVKQWGHSVFKAILVLSIGVVTLHHTKKTVYEYKCQKSDFYGTKGSFH